MGRTRDRAHRLRPLGGDLTRLSTAAVAAALGCASPGPAAADPPAADRRVLPAPEREGGPALFAAIARRRSVRELAGDSLADAELGQLLWAGQGITGAAGERAAPSAGALYPLTLYVADRGGVWRYLPGDHALVHERRDDRRLQLAAAGFGQAPLTDAPVILVIAGREATTARKYGARAARYVALEAGHAAHGILLAVTALGLVAVPVGSYDDAAVRAALSLGPDVTPLYMIPVGRPRGASAE